MVKKTLFIVLLLFAIMQTAFSASLRLDSASYNPVVIKPGDDVELTLRVQNIVSSGEEADFSYVLEVEPRGELAKENILVIDGEDNLGKLGANEFWNSIFNLKIKEGAISANYELDVIVKRYLGSSLVSTNTFTTSISVSGETFFEVDSEDKTISQGETKTFDAVIKNVGGSSTGSVKVTFGNTADIQVLGANTFYFDNIDFDDEKKFEITLYARDNLVSGTYPIPIEIEYNDGSSVRSQSLEAGVLVGGDVLLKVANIQTTPKEVKPGNNYVLVSVNLENAGDDDAKGVSVVLSSDEFESSYSDNNNVFAGRIDSGSYSNLKFYIDVPKDVLSGVYEMKLDVNYLNMIGDEFNETLYVPIYIKEKPILEIKSVEAVGKAGEIIEVKVEVENIGEENAEEVDIRLISDSSLPFTIEERSVYLGGIGSGESKIGIFNVLASRDADFNEYSVRAFIRARGDSEEGDNNIYTYNKNVEIVVDGKALNYLFIGGVIVALVVVIIFIFGKRKRVSSKKK